MQNYTEETAYEKEVTILATTNSPFMLNKKKLTLIWHKDETVSPNGYLLQD